MLTSILTLSLFMKASMAETLPTRSELELRLSMPKQSFVLYEPVTVNYVVSNPTSHAIAASLAIDPSSQKVRFFIRSAGESEQKYSGGAIKDVAVADTLLGAGRFLASTIDLRWNNATDEWAFPKPGRYEISATLWVGGKPRSVYLQSNTLQVEIIEPGGCDARMVEYFSSREDFLGIMHFGPENYCQNRDHSSCVEELKTAIDRSECSAYSPYILYRLASAIANELIKVNSKDAAAADLFDAFLLKWPTHPYAWKAQYGRSLALQRGGHSPAARDPR